MTHYSSYKTSEIWRRDTDDPDLWHGENGLIINTAALEEREAFFETKRMSDPPTKLTPLSSFVSL